MSKKNTSIEISQVGNGFIVSAAAGQIPEGMIPGSISVFQSMEEMIKHIRDHFEYRSPSSIEVD